MMSRDRPLRKATPRPTRVGRHGRPPPHRRTALPRALDQEAFIGVLSHELRTPVTTIYGGAQILATKDLPEGRRRELAADVSQEAERLYRIVEDVVVLLRSQQGELAPAREPVALGRLIAAAIDHEHARSADRRILYLGASDAAADDADPGLVTHVVRNLLDNAVRYSANGSPIEVVVDTDGEEIVVRVLDRGPGPSEPDLRDLIDPGGTSAALAGGGLGLFVAARLVDAMGGRSWARPRRGGGAEFGFALRRSGGGGSQAGPASSAAVDQAASCPS